MEAEIIERLRAGDAQAFAWLVAEYQNRVLNTCYRFLHDREEAEDVAQEVFLEVHRSVGSFRGEAKLSTWIYRIAVTRSLNVIRRRGRKKRLAVVKALLGLGGAEEPRAPESADPARELEQRERLHLLEEAIRRLPEKQGVAFTLSQCEDLASRQVAEVMGLSLAAVDALVHRAKAGLRRQLSGHFTGRGRHE